MFVLPGSDNDHQIRLHTIKDLYHAIGKEEISEIWFKDDSYLEIWDVKEYIEENQQIPMIVCGKLGRI